MYVWQVIPFEGILDLHNQLLNAVVYKTEYLCSRDAGSPIGGLLMGFWKMDDPIILSSLIKRQYSSSSLETVY